VINGETVLFVGGYFEQKGNEVTKYYPGGAMRKYVIPQNMTVNYLLGDQLGSTSLVTDAGGSLLVETRYKPWGEVRWTTQNATLPTRYTFTGQYSYVSDDATDLGAAGFGLMFYNARWYDSTTGRFAQADTVVSGGVQGLDRYAYVGNNPVRYTDPSGHKECESFDENGKCIPPLKEFWVIVCGDDNNLSCASGDGTPLNEYKKQARREGATVVVFDIDDCQAKDVDAAKLYCANQIEAFMADNPGAYTFVGHSAGGSVVIYVVDRTEKGNNGDSVVVGVILLDPDMSIILREKNGRDENENTYEIDLEGEFENIVKAGIPTFVGTSYDNTFFAGYRGNPNYTYKSYTLQDLGVIISDYPDTYYWIAHLALATDLTVSNDAISAISYP
jgi:RHS repeat-associated protein